MNKSSCRAFEQVPGYQIGEIGKDKRKPWVLWDENGYAKGAFRTKREARKAIPMREMILG